MFNRMNLSLAVTEAARTFHTRWRGLLNLDYNPRRFRRSTGLESRRPAGGLAEDEKQAILDAFSNAGTTRCGLDVMRRTCKRGRLNLCAATDHRERHL